MFERGYLTLFRLGGIPFRVHWSLPLGVFVWSGLRFAPGIWLGVFTLIVVHELGHAVLVRRFGLAVLGIDVTGFGGRCLWTGRPSPRERAAIAWGGVLAQLPILAVALPLRFALGPMPLFVDDLLEAFTYVNALLIALNLIPFPPLDGAEAWPWFRYWRDDRRRKQKWKARLAPRPASSTSAPREELNQTLKQALEEADRRR